MPRKKCGGDYQIEWDMINTAQCNEICSFSYWRSGERVEIGTLGMVLHHYECVFLNSVARWGLGGLKTICAAVVLDERSVSVRQKR